jgi:hypothetical protein
VDEERMTVQKLIGYKVTLPSGNTFTVDHNTGFSEEDFEWLEERFNVGSRVSKADLAQALVEDCESGVKWLNERALDTFKKDYPHLYKVISE